MCVPACLNICARCHLTPFHDCVMHAAVLDRAALPSSQCQAIQHDAVYVRFSHHRRFVVATLSKLVRLSYRSRIASVIPPPFAALLADSQDVLPLPGPPEAPAAAAAPAADDGGDGASTNGVHEDERDAETQRAFQLLQMVRTQC